jgi:hypothetical protein
MTGAAVPAHIETSLCLACVLVAVCLAATLACDDGSDNKNIFFRSIQSDTKKES